MDCLYLLGRRNKLDAQRRIASMKFSHDVPQESTFAKPWRASKTGENDRRVAHVLEYLSHFLLAADDLPCVVEEAVGDEERLEKVTEDWNGPASSRPSRSCLLPLK